MKKTNTKTKSPAPATSTTGSTKKKTSTAAKAKKAEVAPKITMTAPVVPNGFVPAAVKAVVPAVVQTKIVARIDVGFGNALYVRGDGPGLSWNQGVPMECIAADQWELVLGESSRPVSFKILLNDVTWCSGPDSVVASGSTATFTPDFA